VTDNLKNSIALKTITLGEETMKYSKLSLLALVVATVVAGQASFATAGSFTQAFKTGDASGDIRMRYESVDQETKGADAMTVRTRLSYTTGSMDGFSATVGMEDVRVVADMDEYNDATFGEYPTSSVIADPETTELDQAYIQYKSGGKKNGLVAKAGRQVIAWDGQRFIGHVGWRQNRQTFDGLTTVYKADAFTAKYAYISERNRIFSDTKDVDSADHLLNLSYITPVGTLTGYSYMLTEDPAAGADVDIDTYGVSFKGAVSVDDVKYLYALEYADQEKDVSGVSKKAEYMLLEGGVAVSGITVKLGYEVLGSDQGTYGFATPLATGHKFNGWSDQFLGTPNAGLQDMYLSVATKVAGGKLAVIYHDFSNDEATASGDDQGNELNVIYAKKFGKSYSAGVKYAAFDKGTSSSGKGGQDTDKLWVWIGAKF